MTEKTKRFGAFPIPEYSDWKAAAEKALKGAPFDKKMYNKTYEGITLNPIYTAEDIKKKEYLSCEFPGLPDYLRGSTASGYKASQWLVSQNLNIRKAKDFNQALKAAINNGQTSVSLNIACKKSDGLEIRNLKDFEDVLEGIDITQIPIFINAGDSAYVFASILNAYCEKHGAPKSLVKGSLEFDPLYIYGRDGCLHAAKETYYDELAELVNWAELNFPQMKVIALNAGHYHEAGASAVQEIAFILSSLTEYIDELTERGIPFERIANKFKINLKASSDFFMEIAKTKALRFLWSKVMSSFRLDLEPEPPYIHIETSSRNKSSLDPYVNMLRTTVESFSAVLGGANSISVSSFDCIYNNPTEFSRRISRNQHYIIKEEAHLTDTIDPSAGSWFIESLVYELAGKAWNLFREIEGDGGMFDSLRKGTIQNRINEVLTARINDLNSRKETLLGVNKYPNINEDYNAAKSLENNKLETVRPIEIEAVTLDNLTNLITNGADVGSIISSIHKSDTYKTMPIKSVRLASNFESLRKNASNYKIKNGNLPKVYLANFGTLKEYKGRADFSADFFAVGGFQSEWSQGFNDIESAAKAYLDAGIETAVICSTDENYKEYAALFTKLVKQEKPNAKVILAGLPADLIDELKNAGVDDFIHIKANVFETLKNLQDELGISNRKEIIQGAAI